MTNERDKVIAEMRAQLEFGRHSMASAFVRDWASRLSAEAGRVEGEGLLRDVVDNANVERAKLEACKPWMKDGETPAQAMERLNSESVFLLGALAKERTARNAAPSPDAVAAGADFSELCELLRATSEDIEQMRMFRVNNVPRVPAIAQLGGWKRAVDSAIAILARPAPAFALSGEERAPVEVAVGRGWISDNSEDAQMSAAESCIAEYARSEAAIDAMVERACIAFGHGRPGPFKRKMRAALSAALATQENPK